MAEKKISEMSLEELKRYEEELNRKLAAVKFCMRRKLANGAKCAKVKVPRR